MSIKDTGGRAFASIAIDPKGDLFDQPGMTLRDWFAGQALLGMTASPELMQLVTSKADGGEGLPFERMARQAYAQADAMIAERDK